ncbi:MAG: PEP-CTERM sorting domain-containing protein [Planctomycetota bacterium]
MVTAFGSATATPIFDAFEPLPQATFGGQGIPNDEVAVSRAIVDGDVTITVAMSATQRFSNPPLTNDGAGTYFATPGTNFGANNESSTEGSLWNFNYYMTVEGANGATPILADYQFDLFYDFDPGADNTLGSLGSINLTNSILASPEPAATLLEGSQNLLFGFLGSTLPGFITAPSGSFDPNALGEYTFAIQVSRAGFGVETVAMDVQVIPEPTSLALLGLGGLIVIRQRRRRC